MPISEAEKAWKQKNTRFYGLRIQNSSGIPDALDHAVEDGYTINGYAIRAITNQLIEDGYLSGEKKKGIAKDYSGPKGKLIK